MAAVMSRENTLRHCNPDLPASIFPGVGVGVAFLFRRFGPVICLPAKEADVDGKGFDGPVDGFFLFNFKYFTILSIT